MRIAPSALATIATVTLTHAASAQVPPAIAAPGESAVVTLHAEGAQVYECKAGVVVGVTDDLTSRFSAIDLVRKGAEVLGGKGGGGRADMAQAGGPDGSKAEAALKAIEGALSGG